MDDGTPIAVKIVINNLDGSAIFDFNGTGSQVFGNCNAPPAVTYSAIIYCLRCLVNLDIPLNQGCLKPIKIIVPKNSILRPSSEAAVVGGNVLTSQRVTDVILKAFNACGASQGCMNNLTFGDETFPPLNIPIPHEPFRIENCLKITGYRLSNISGSVILVFVICV